QTRRGARAGHGSRFLAAAAAGGDDRHDNDHRDDAHRTADQGQAFAADRASPLSLLQRLALRARLLTTLLAREVLLAALHRAAHRPTFTGFRSSLPKDLLRLARAPF